RDWLRKGILIILPFAPKPNRRLPLVTLNPGAYLIRWWAWSSKPLGGPKRPPIGSTPIRSRHASNYPANRLVWFVSEDRGRVACQAAPDPLQGAVRRGRACPARGHCTNLHGQGVRRIEREYRVCYGEAKPCRLRGRLMSRAA